MTNKQYLGDGAYVTFNQQGIALTAEDGLSVTNTIHLNDRVLVSLLRQLPTYYKKHLLIAAIEGTYDHS